MLSRQQRLMSGFLNAATVLLGEKTGEFLVPGFGELLMTVGEVEAGLAGWSGRFPVRLLRRESFSNLLSTAGRTAEGLMQHPFCITVRCYSYPLCAGRF